MGANSTFIVTVLKATEADVEVSALTGWDAIREAEKMPGVIKALCVKDDIAPCDDAEFGMKP